MTKFYKIFATLTMLIMAGFVAGCAVNSTADNTTNIEIAEVSEVSEVSATNETEVENVENPENLENLEIAATVADFSEEITEETEDVEETEETEEIEETEQEEPAEEVGETAEIAETAEIEETQAFSRGLIVAIDPGHQRHGNSTHEPNGPNSANTRARVSSGTRGTTSGVPEFELVLDVAKLLRTELELRGFAVVMTRESHDVDISNAERAQFATAENADIFVRIHADGNNNPAVSGIMTISHTANNPYIPHLHADSLRLSQNILDEMVASTGGRSRGVWQSDTFTGTNWATMPTTIVEMGFMTNPTEDLLMQTLEYQLKLVDGMANGIERFFGG